MIVTDTQIGENLKRVRGELSQRELAKRMRARGINWTHLTVASVERGDRPMRVAEAVELGYLLDTEPEMFFLEEATSAYYKVLKELTYSLDRFYEAVDSLHDEHEEFTLAADEATEDASRDVGGSGTQDAAIRLRAALAEATEILSANEQWIGAERHHPLD